MIFKILILGILLCKNISYGNSRKLPSWIKPCRRSDPNVEKCLLTTFENMRPRLAKGIPDVKIPSLDPFKLPEIKLDQGTGSVNFRAKIKNLVASGGKSVILKQLKIDWNGPTVFVEVFFPNLDATADYDINGKVLIVPIIGIGKLTGNFKNVTVTVSITGKYEKKAGKTYMSIKNRKVNFTLDNLQLNFSNLFNGNKELSASTNKFINQNWKEILPELRPLIEDTTGEIITQIASGLLTQFSLEEAFLP